MPTRSDEPTTGEGGAGPGRSRRGPLRQIGEVAALVGLSLRTVRHYEEAGLVSPVTRTAGGFRLYDDGAVGRLQLIMKMKPLGFTLEEMRQLIEARQRLAGAAEDVEAVDLRARVAMFAAAAGERCVQLREQLAIAESFLADLEDEVGPDQRRR